ncbi:MAG: hypothetical protein AAFY09_12010 [Pseudomonadota bacterium]
MKFEFEFRQQKGIAIQSSGALLAYRATDSLVVLASDNWHEFLGGPVRDLPLGRYMHDLVGTEIFHALRNASAIPSIKTRHEYIGRFRVADRELDCSTFQSGDCIVLEMTEVEPDPVPSAYDTLKDVLLFQDRIKAAANENAVFLNIVSLLRTISGYDYVAACRYRENHSDIVASSGHSLSAFETFEVNSQLHIVPNLDQKAIKVHALADVDQFDLSLSWLRWPPTPSLEKLRKIGASASMIQGIEQHDRIWGYFTFLHRTPRAPNHRTRLTLAHIQPLLRTKLQNCQKS